MATVQQVITSRLERFNVLLSTVEMDMLLADHNLYGNVVYENSLAVPVKTAILSQVLTILAVPDITEGGYSIKWDRLAVRAYATQLQTELGLVSSESASVTDKSYLF